MAQGAFLNREKMADAVAERSGISDWLNTMGWILHPCCRVGRIYSHAPTSKKLCNILLNFLSLAIGIAFSAREQAIMAFHLKKHPNQLTVVIKLGNTPPLVPAPRQQQNME